MTARTAGAGRRLLAAGGRLGACRSARSSRCSRSALRGLRRALLGRQAGRPRWIATVLFVSASATVGALVASKRPAIPGALLSATALCYAAATASLLIAVQPWGERLADWMGNWIWGLGLALPVTFGPLLFPDGHLPSLLGVPSPGSPDWGSGRSSSEARSRQAGCPRANRPTVNPVRIRRRHRSCRLRRRCGRPDCSCPC